MVTSMQQIYRLVLNMSALQSIALWYNSQTFHNFYRPGDRF